MEAPPIPFDEEQRLASLRSLGLLDTAPEERFDRITRMAQRLFDVPIALVSLVDEDRQWFKSRSGLDLAETPRTASFCAHAIVHDDNVLLVEDALEDRRFADNPLVIGAPNIRFYAGAPIAGPDGSLLGSLCVIDRRPRGMSQEDQHALQELAHMIEHEIAVTHLAMADELTGLSNRRGLRLLGRQLLRVCDRQQVPATMAFVDLDGLKAINDEQGHEAGDDAIREVAAALEDTFRAADVIARLGGDELCALLVDTRTADVPIERLRASLEGRSDVTGLRLRVSIGCAVYEPGSGVPLDDLISEADAAMYEEKGAKASSR